MILNWKDFELEQDLRRFEHLVGSVSEMKEFDDFTESLSEYLEELYEKGIDYVGKFLEKVYNRFRWKRSVIIFTLIILTTKVGCNMKDLMGYLNIPEKEKQELVSEVRSKSKAQKGLRHFLKAIADRESSGNPREINTLGYIGKYQFGRTALKEVGLNNKIDTDKFRRNPKIWPEHQQDKAMIELMRKNIGYLGNYIGKFDGRKIRGINITKSGLVAGAHLLGPTNVKKFLDSNGTFDPEDGYGTKLSEYLKKFAGYEINI